MGGREGRPGWFWEQSGQTRELFTPDCSLHRLEHTRKCVLGRCIRRRNGRYRDATDATRTKTERRNTHPGPALEIRRTQTTQQNLSGRRGRGHRGTERKLGPGHQRTPLDLQTPLGGSGFPWAPEDWGVPFVFRAWCELTATLGRKNGGARTEPRIFACNLFRFYSRPVHTGWGGIKCLRLFYKPLETRRFHASSLERKAA